MKYKIKKYKDINLYYNADNGKINFEFEGQAKTTNYIFEAEQIIDEPIWENCEEYGYFLDGYINKFIGIAKAIKKDRKSGKYDWYLKGQFETEFKKPNWNDNTKIFLKNKKNDEVYKQWLEQKIIYNMELNKLNNIAFNLSD